MDISNLEDFQRIISYSNRLNESNDTPFFIYIFNGYIRMVKGFRVQNLNDCIGIAVIGRKNWRNGQYINASATLLALADQNYTVKYDIEVGNGFQLFDIGFETYKSSYYDKFKPFLKLEKKTTHEIIELHLDEEHGWDNDFPTLFEKMFSLVEA